ncbi:hypothetical protein [Pseudomonas oryzihabitans]|uniref:hypothetical protein n=1 Tax=Pseudomonas oryzihabitans TaxID=47885 RepID=UPI00112094D0|nr:hypothetical protein [Pseudomonas psychrotolerans]
MDAARPTGRCYPTLSLPFAVAASSQEVRQAQGGDFMILAPLTLPRAGRIPRVERRTSRGEFLGAPQPDPVRA